MNQSSNLSSLLLAAQLALQNQVQLQNWQNIRDQLAFYQLQLLPNQMIPLSPHPFFQVLSNSLSTLSTQSTCSSAHQQFIAPQKQTLTFSQAFNILQNQPHYNEQEQFPATVQSLSPLNQQDQFSIESEEKKNGLSEMELEENEEKCSEKRLISLAQRNVMINFASGLRDFIKFQIQLYKLRHRNQDDVFKYETEMMQLSKWIQIKQKEFRCYEGWKSMLEDTKFGSQLHKISTVFFSKHFALTYIKKSRINESYKQEHYCKIKKFQAALQNYSLFNAHFFKKQY